MARQCEREACTEPVAEDLGGDYCAECGRSLCGFHMGIGCCGRTPAASGREDERATAQERS